MDITISFENMVYEDALTILSYASPYPVRLHLQKTQPDKGKSDTGEDTDGDETVHHPVYRSQSMDDVSKIQKERFSFRMRRARSEMKRGSSKNRNKIQDEADSGTLRKWKAKQDIVASDSAMVQAEVADQSFSIPNMNINANDLMADFNESDRVKTEATIHQQQANESHDGSIRVLEVDIPDKSQSFERSFNSEIDDKNRELEKLRAEIQSEFNAAPAEMMGKAKVATTAASPIKDDNEMKFTSDGKLVLGGLEHLEDNRPEISVKSHGISLQRKESSASDRSSRCHSGEDDDEDIGNEIDNDFLMRALKLSEPDSQLVPDVGSEVTVGKQDESVVIPTIEGRKSPTGSHHSSPSPVNIPGIDVNSENENDYVVINLAREQAEQEARERAAALDIPDTPSKALDETNASMIVHVNEESMLMRDDPQLPLESVQNESTVSASAPMRKISGNSDDEEMRMLKDYLGDRPSLFEKYILESDGEGEKQAVVSGVTVHKTVTVTKVGSDGTTTETKTETVESSLGDKVIKTTSSAIAHDGDNAELSVLKSKALSDAKREIRRRSNSSEEDKSSDGSSFSSRSSSPHPDDLDLMDLSALKQKLTMQVPPESPDQSDTEDGAKKSGSPDIKRRSGGGLSFDITATEFEKMPDEIPQEPRGEPKGGMAYYVGIDDEVRVPGSVQLGGESIPKPSLVSPWEPAEGEPQRRGSHSSGASSDSGHGTKIQSEAIDASQITFKVPGSGLIEGNNNELDIKHGVNLDMNFNGRNSSLDSTPVGSPSKSTTSDIISQAKAEMSERITIKTHDEAKGAYTMTLNSLDDSEA